MFVGYSIKIMNKTSQKLIVADEDSEIKWEEVFHYEENNDGPYDVVSAKVYGILIMYMHMHVYTYTCIL